ncbi:MAG: hypothetical protein PHS38_14355 [Bacteroidales bacterium]|nr:hypothetical protein [Bacteroidales bacterium]
MLHLNQTTTTGKMALRQITKYDWPEVWKEFREGDMEAFQKIYNGFLEKLYAYGSKLTSNFAVVEDSIQELFLAIPIVNIK